MTSKGGHKISRGQSPPFGLPLNENLFPNVGTLSKKLYYGLHMHVPKPVLKTKMSSHPSPPQVETSSYAYAVSLV